MGSILQPGYVRWDGFKYVLDPTVEIVGPPGPPGPALPGPPGPQGPGGNIENSGTPLVGNPYNTLNFAGAGVSATDGGATALITISGVPQGSAAGDLSGSYPSPTVIGIHGDSVPAPSGTNTVLSWSGSAFSWAAQGGAPTGTAGGDLYSTYPNPKVGQLQGSIVLSGTPTTGQALLATSATAASWQSLATPVYATGTTPPLSTSLTWVNQAGATAIDNATGGFDIICPTPGDNATWIHALVATAPSAPYTFTVGVIIDNLFLVGGGNFHMGMVSRESSTGKMLVLNMTDQVGSGGTVVSSWTNATTIALEDYITPKSGANNAILAYNGGLPFIGPTWFRIQNTGTDLLWSRSLSGSNIFYPLGVTSNGTSPFPIAINDFFTTGPNQIGVGVGQTYAPTPGPGMRVFSWTITTP